MVPPFPLSSDTDTSVIWRQVAYYIFIIDDIHLPEKINYQTTIWKMSDICHCIHSIHLLVTNTFFSLLILFFKLFNELIYFPAVYFYRLLGRGSVAHFISFYCGELESMIQMIQMIIEFYTVLLSSAMWSHCIYSEET